MLGPANGTQGRAQPDAVWPSTAGTLALTRMVPASTSVTTPRYLPKKRLRSRSSTSISA